MSNGRKRNLYTLKVDLDVEYSSLTLELFRLNVENFIAMLGFNVLQVYFRRSRNGNVHAYIFAEHPEKFTPRQLAWVQAIIGDDPSRVKLNFKRASSGLLSWNVLSRYEVAANGIST